MKIEQLEALGFSVVAGQVDRLGKNYGFLAPTGAVLTPEGEELAMKLQLEQAPKAAEKPVVREPKPPKAKPVARVEEAPKLVENPTEGLLDGLDDILE